MKLNYLLSVGYNCGAAYQLRYHTGIGEAHFFDWLYTSIEAATFLIETDFRDFLNRERVSVVRDGTEVLVQPSGIRLNHSFKRGRNVDPEWLERDFETERAKFDYLAGKLRGILSSGDAVGLVRYNPYRDRYDDSEKIKKLESVLRRRLGHEKFRLIWVRNSGMTSVSSASNTVIFDIDENPERSTSLKGKSFIGTDDVAWGEVVAALDLDLRHRMTAKHQAVIL